MPLYTAMIITPWVEAASDPSPEPANHPQLIDDHQHQLTSLEEVVQSIPTATHTWQQAIAEAEGCGELFRTALGKMDLNTIRIGYGIRLPETMLEGLLDQLKQLQRPMSPWIMGPHDAGDSVIQIVKLTETVVQEGVRLQENWTGQDTRMIAPTPNQYTVHAIAAESVMLAIEADPTYWILSSQTMPEDPESPPPPANPALDFPPDAVVDPARQAAYEQWQADNDGAPRRFTREINRRLMAGTENTATYGEKTLVTISWQRSLTGQASGMKIPLRETVELMMDRLRGLPCRKDAAKMFPASQSEILIGT